MKSAVLDDLRVGQNRVLTDTQVASLWGGIDSQYSPDHAVGAVNRILPKEEYEQLFPNRLGSKKLNKSEQHTAEQADYYSYNNLIAAVKDIANIKYKLEYRQHDTNMSRVFRLDKGTQTETLIYQHADMNAPSNQTIPLISKIIDFGSFVKEGPELKRKRELAAFLANIAHETGRGRPVLLGRPLDWGLYWNEEISYIGTTTVHYAEAHDVFPPVAGKSYHGRGPMQLSWNYNYGLISSIIYGTKDTLLQQPELIVNDGKLGFMTAILFWMTPQPPKPSAHDVMVGNWTPSGMEIAKGLSQPGFGITIMIINGNLEGNLDEADRRIHRRVGFYRKITSLMGISIEGEKVNTLGMSPF